MTTDSSPNWVAGSVDYLRALTPEQRCELRELARRSPNDAEACLQVVLRRWHSTIVHRYVQEVLVDGGDHDLWTAAHARIPDWDESVAARLGRDLSDDEKVEVDDIADLTAAHRDVCRQLNADHGLVTSTLYLKAVTAHHPLGLVADYIEYVIHGGMAQAEWESKRRPLFAAPPRG